jgi:hypothetical protein
MEIIYLKDYRLFAHKKHEKRENNRQHNPNLTIAFVVVSVFYVIAFSVHDKKS